jgi:hypothetical protein
MLVSNRATPPTEKQEQHDEAATYPAFPQVAQHPEAKIDSAALNGAAMANGIGWEWAARHTDEGSK